MRKKAKRAKKNKIDKKLEFKKIKNKDNEKEIKVKTKIKLALLGMVIILVLAIGVTTAVKANNFKNLVLDMARNENSRIIDRNGNTLETIGSEKAKNKVVFEKIPNNLKNAYVAIEDERYYKHGGIDVKRTSSAIVSYIFRKGSFGGSSIAQQLVKNLTGDNSNKISRKVNEWWKACVVDSAMEKDEILELYLNVIYAGPNIYGVETASQYYFSKSVENLTLEECAFLAGLNHSPNSYNPFNGADNKEKIAKRTKIVIEKMQELKYISDEEAQTAISKVDAGLNFKNGSIKTGDSVYSYHTDALLTQVIGDLTKRKNISDTFATNYIEMAGLTIYSTQESNVQKQLETEFEKSKYVLKSKNNSDTSQAAMIVIDQTTGNVTGCVGGLGKKTTSRGFNRATQSVRQTGSSIKPIAVLVPGIAKRTFTGSTIFSDELREFADGYSPEDYSNELGDITVRRAIESSQNIPFVEMMEKIKPSNAIRYLKKMGVTTLTEKDNNLTLALGGLDRGISPLQMAAAYATIANDGVYIEPTFYTKVVNASNRNIITAKQKTRRVFSKNVAYIIKELLTEPVNGEYGTAKYCKIAGMDVAAKTGTTDENYDRWLCGFTPYYTGVAWYGYDQNETVLYGGKKNPAGIIWANVMSSIHKPLANASFEKPKLVMKVKVCSDTGKKATSGCKNTYDEYFLIGTIPGSCTKHSGTSSNTTTTTNKVTTNSFDTTTLEDLDSPVVEDNNNNDIVYNTTLNDKTNTTTENKNTVTNTTSQNTTNTNNITSTNTTTNTTQTTVEPENQKTEDMTTQVQMQTQTQTETIDSTN